MQHIARQIPHSGEDLCTSRMPSWPVVQHDREEIRLFFPVVVKKGLREHSLC
jgi:hypothetical protein